MRSLCLCIHGCPVYYGNGWCLTLDDRGTKNKQNKWMNAKQDVFVLVLQSGASCAAASPIWERMLWQRPHEIALCHGNIQALFPFKECNLPENLLTKRYIISGAPKCNPWPIWPLYRTFSLRRICSTKRCLCVKGELTKGGTNWEPSLRHMGTSFSSHSWNNYGNTSLDFPIQNSIWYICTVNYL